MCMKQKTNGWGETAELTQFLVSAMNYCCRAEIGIDPAHKVSYSFTHMQVITLLTQLFVFGVLAGQHNKEILTGVLIQQGAVVQADVNN